MRTHLHIGTPRCTQNRRRSSLARLWLSLRVRASACVAAEADTARWSCGTASSERRLRPKPQLPTSPASPLPALGDGAAAPSGDGAGVASAVTVAAASGDVRGKWYDDVRLRASSARDMSSPIEPVGESVGVREPERARSCAAGGGSGPGVLVSVGDSRNGSAGIGGSSEIAVVGDAFASAAPGTGNAGSLPGEKRDEIDIRDARDIGRGIVAGGAPGASVSVRVAGTGVGALVGTS
jgi:hypothetical protein